MLDEESVMPIIPNKAPSTEKEKPSRYKYIRKNLPIFNTNFISGGFFRNGINLNNYKIVEARDVRYVTGVPQSRKW